MNRYWITFWIIYAVTLVLYPPVILNTDAPAGTPIIQVQPGVESPILDYFFHTSTIIMGPADECVDTYLINDISCADKEAVIKYRQQLQAIERQKLEEKIEESKREQDGYYYVPHTDPTEFELQIFQHRVMKEC